MSGQSISNEVRLGEPRRGLRHYDFAIRIWLDLSQIERAGEFGVRFGRRNVHWTRRVGKTGEASQAAAFGLVAVHGQSGVVAATRMSDMIRATPERATVPAI